MRTIPSTTTPEALAELRHLTPLMHFERGDITLYTFRGGESPHLMMEVGRLRESAFRLAGGGTGREVDIDAHDVAADGYRQLIAWNRSHSRIVGGYRYIVGRSCCPRHISSSHYFHLGERFVADYLPHAIELGRSFTVRGEGASSLFAMESLWRALGHIVSREEVSYLFGKVTIYPHYDGVARRLLLQFLYKFCHSRERLIWPRKEMEITHLSGDADGDAGRGYGYDDTGRAVDNGIAAYGGVGGGGVVDSSDADPFVLEGYEANYALLERLLRERHERIPPMLHAYMRLTREIAYFGAVRNDDFGHATEAAILLPIDSILPSRRERYIY